jgi:ubiquinone/menaquinone biosynthesis C-methylase UbiE
MHFLKPDSTVAHFHLCEGDRVADFGAGSGHFSFEMAKAVGNSGRVFAVEIQKNLAEAIQLEARKKRQNNIDVIWGDLESGKGVRLANGSLNAGLLSNTLFQAQNKEQVLREISRAIEVGGKLFLIEWADSFGGVGPQSSDIIPEMQARALAEGVGFVLERSFPAGAHHYGLAFRRA